MPTQIVELTYRQRLEALHAKKLEQTKEKQDILGAMDHDDWALILPSPDMRKIVQATSGSGVTITDALIDGLEMESNHLNGSFYGPRICGENFRRLLDAHPIYIDPMCSIAGVDATHGSLDYYNLGVDGAALATAADSFAAVQQRIEEEGRMSWHELLQHLDANWEGPTGERARLMMKSVPRYGSGGSQADRWASRIAQTFTEMVEGEPTDGFMLTPGLFSWASTIAMGHYLGATPDGRHAGDPISHGSNPNPGFREDGATTALAVAIAAVQPGLGNAAPMQLELDPGLSRTSEDVEKVSSLIRTHFDLGGTQINLNVLDKEKVLEAHADPSKHPDLIVRVTGFSAYFASLSPEFRQLVVDRIIAEA